MGSGRTEVNMPIAQLLISEVPSIVTLVVAFGGWILLFIQMRSNQNTQERARTEGYLFEGLKWFEGKTQKRNIGIAIVEGYWSRCCRIKPCT